MTSNFERIPDHKLQPAPAIEGTLKSTPFHVLVTKIDGGLIVRPDLTPISGEHTNIVSAGSVSAHRALTAAGLDKLNYAESLPISKDARKYIHGPSYLFETRTSNPLNPDELVEREYDLLAKHHAERIAELEAIDKLSDEQRLQQELAKRSLAILAAYDMLRQNPKNASRRY